jgi:hypothetical protein
MVNTYKLVNPQIKGTLKTKIKSPNSVEAAKEIYNNLSEHFNNNIPKFYFTIQKGSSGKGKYYHFLVEEKRKGENVSFSIEPITLKGESSSNKKLEKTIEKYNNRGTNQEGGGKNNKKSKKKKRVKKKKPTKKKNDSDDSDDSDDLDDSDDSDDYELAYVTTFNYPIDYWYYYPTIYDIDSYFVPTFYNTVTPYIEIVY